mgnify:CR=1 FL=1
MPINIPDDLPAYKVLTDENIFVMNQTRATTQRIRPLKILIVNIMPLKITTETQLLRLLSNTPLQLEVELIHMSTHDSKNVPKEHLLTFYKTFKDIKENSYDGMIITGAPVEQMSFEEVDYWNELCEILEWAKTHVFSSFLSRSASSERRLGISMRKRKASFPSSAVFFSRLRMPKATSPAPSRP